MLAQWRWLISRSPNPERYDCASHHKYHPNCLLNVGEFEIEVPDFTSKVKRHRRKIRSAEDIWAYLEFAQEAIADEPGFAEYDDVKLLLVNGVDICPAVLFTQLSYELYRMYNYCGQHVYPYPGGYLDQLSIYIEASAIIAREEARLNRLERAKLEKEYNG